MDTRIYRYMDKRIPGYTDTRIYRYNDTRIQGYTDTRIYRYKDIQIQGYTDTRIYGYKDIRIQGYTDTRIYRYKDIQMGVMKQQGLILHLLDIERMDSGKENTMLTQLISAFRYFKPSLQKPKVNTDIIRIQMDCKHNLK